MAFAVTEGMNAALMMRRFLAVVAIIIAISGRAIALVHVRSSGPGCGAPPCVDSYQGSGHAAATPPPGPNAVPTANPGGILYPGCTCAFPPPPTRPPPLASSPSPGPAPAPAPPIPGEVEVLTVDLHLANKVRCDNASIAAEVANLLKIPVQRVTVQPWSWALPGSGNGVAQSSYLAAFVQEDHERCDCQGENGRVAVGQGFRNVQGSASSNGLMISPDRSVMTVAQYDAAFGVQQPQAQQQGTATGSPPGSASAPAPAGTPTFSAVRGPRAQEPPASRVQMLTRDPCLVYLLREMTPEFKEKIAFLLGVPEDKVIIDPPPVKGTVGLLQLDSSVSSKSKGRPVPVMAVQHCSLVDLAELGQRLSLIDVAQASAPAPAPSLAMGSSPALPTVYTVAVPNNTNTMNATDQRVSLVMKMDNLNYELLAASWPLVSSFTTVVKAAIGEAAHVPASAVKISLWPGSTVIEAEITPPNGTAAAAVFAFLNSTVCNATVDRLTALNASLISAYTDQNWGLECTVMSLELKDPPFDVDQSNRAWIALWSVTILEPFAQDGAWRLLQMVNDPNSKLSKVLPVTLARIPGLKYRGLKVPNLAIKESNESRLPPPEDKAVGFRLPDPYDEEARMQAEQKRMKRENAASALRIKGKADMELMRANDALRKSQQAKLVIAQADAQFTNAARVHAQAIRAPNASMGPDIVPFEVIESYHLRNESPYPWRDQVPAPRFQIVLAQGQQPQQQHAVKSPAHHSSLLSQRRARAALHISA